MEFIINLPGADCACRFVMLLGSRVDFFFIPFPIGSLAANYTSPSISACPPFCPVGISFPLPSLIQPELLEIPVFINFRPAGATGVITRPEKHFRSAAYQPRYILGHNNWNYTGDKSTLLKNRFELLGCNLHKYCLLHFYFFFFCMINREGYKITILRVSSID